MAITKLTTPELLDFPNNSTSSANTSGTVIPTGTTAINVDYLVVAGGGGGGGYIAGGGGAGGLRTSYGNTSGGGSPSESTLILNTATNYTITIGGGGTGVASPTQFGTNGDDSIFATITSTGGGGGGGRLGLEGGSGGGSQYGDGNTTGYGNDIRIAGIKNQGYSGSAGNISGYTYGGGGGGAGGPGTFGTTACSSQQGGGPGLSVSITGVAVTYASGGDGGGNDGVPCTVNGGNNTGNGGSGSNQNTGGGNGGSGIIVLRVASTVTATFSAGVTSTLTQVGGGAWSSGDKIYTITDTTPASQTVSFTTTTATIRPTTNLDAGEFRYNTTLGFVEYYNGSNWKQIADEYISGQPSTCVCNFPTTAAALYQFQANTNDTCGNYSGTPTNISYVDGKFGLAASFNGTSSTINFGDSYIFSPSVNPLSFSLWIKTTNNTRYIFSKGSAGAYEYGLLNNASGQMELVAYNLSASSSVVITTSSAYNDGNWHHIVAIYDPSGNFKIYVDGSQQATSSTSITMGNSSNALIFGKKFDVSAEYDGLIDQVRIFNTVLSASEVTSLYNEVGCE